MTSKSKRKKTTSSSDSQTSSQDFGQVVQAIIPAGESVTIGEKYYRDKEWQTAHVKVTKNKLICSFEDRTISIPLSDIYYLDRELDFSLARSPNVLNFSYDTSEGGFVGLIKTPSKDRFKKRILTNVTMGSKVSYISPYKIGEKAYTDKEWQTGVFGFTKNKDVKIVSLPNKNETTEIPGDDLFRIETTQMKGKEALMLFFRKDEKVRVDILAPFDIDLSVLRGFFSTILEKNSRRNLKLEKSEMDLLESLGIIEDKKKRQYNRMSTCIDDLDMGHEEAIEKMTQLFEKEAIEVIDMIATLTEDGKRALEGEAEEIEESEEDKEESKDLEEKRRKKRKKLKKWVEKAKKKSDS